MLAAACGARPVRLGAAEHDAAVAAISHVPLVLAVALVEAMAGGPGEPEADGWPAAASLAAGGWASATRLALGDPAMGAAIARPRTRVALAARLREPAATARRMASRCSRPATPRVSPTTAALRARLAAAGPGSRATRHGRRRERRRTARDAGVGGARLNDEHGPRGAPGADHGSPAWRGILSRGTEPYLAAIAEAGRFEPRAAMERDPSFKQVIPYLVLRDGGRYFLMRRTRAGGDERLHERFSIGVGGHLNPGDVDLAGGLAREWSEELAADFVPDFALLGLLNDDDDRGRARPPRRRLRGRGRGTTGRRPRDEQAGGSFVAPAALLAVYDRMETWSQLVFDFVSGRAAGVRGRLGTGREAPPL